MLIVFVWSTLFMRDNKVWIELMHFALKYYSILIWLNEWVNEWMNEGRSVLSAEGVNFMNYHCIAAKKNGSSNSLLMVFILFCNSTCFACFSTFFEFICLSGDCFFNHSLFNRITKWHIWSKVFVLMLKCHEWVPLLI